MKKRQLLQRSLYITGSTQIQRPCNETPIQCDENPSATKASQPTYTCYLKYYIYILYIFTTYTLPIYYLYIYITHLEIDRHYIHTTIQHLCATDLDAPAIIYSPYSIFNSLPTPNHTTGRGGYHEHTVQTTTSHANPHPQGGWGDTMTMGGGGTQNLERTCTFTFSPTQLFTQDRTSSYVGC